ncbi:hypothetical protein F383_12896 [Gossypium arboreum]|uniref:Uncharacterized protein n=1 Tax=Gossypium arboreum TaxID=29729 RepID=A0A0B0PUE2_GOSAR|nr:hypothetical protein F383_12896 [Gossypium arboreum]
MTSYTHGGSLKGLTLKVKYS